MCAGRGSLATADVPATELVDFGINQFATGTKGVGGAEGTWRDAENAQLGGNPIAQGSVDSTMGLHLEPAGAWKSRCLLLARGGPEV